MENKRDSGVGTLFNNYVSSKTRLVDTQDLSTVNAPKKRGRKRKILTEQEMVDKKERRRSQNQKAAQTLRNKRERQMNDLKEQVELLVKEKSELETLVHNLQEEKQQYLLQLQIQKTKNDASSSGGGSPNGSIARIGVISESAELVDMPSGMTYNPSQLITNMLVVSLCVMHCVFQWSLVMMFDTTHTRRTKSRHPYLHLSLPIPSTSLTATAPMSSSKLHPYQLPNLLHLKPVLIFLAILSSRPLLSRGWNSSIPLCGREQEISCKWRKYDHLVSV